MPPCAVSSRPGLVCAAPVNAPRSWPNSSLSSSVSGSAAQLRRTNGCCARGERRWIVSANTSLPTPVSPRMSTLMVPCGDALDQPVQVAHALVGDDGALRRRAGDAAYAIPPGTMVHNLELYPGRGGQAVRTAGAAAQLLSKEGDLALVKMPSGEVRKFSLDCMATVGQVGNLDHENETYGKAGRTRWRGKKPTVRGVAMNPVDHPHGGGEGKVKGNHPQTPWAFPTLGKKTRHNKRTERMIEQRRK